MWGAYLCMGAYKRNVVIVINMGAYIQGVLILCGCLSSRFYGNMHGVFFKEGFHCRHVVCIRAY